MPVTRKQLGYQTVSLRVVGKWGDVRIEGILGCEGRGKNRRMHLETMYRWVVQEGWDAEDEEHETGNKKGQTRENTWLYCLTFWKGHG